MKKRTLLIAGLLLAAAVVSCGETAPEKEPVPTEPLSSGEEVSSEGESVTEPVTEEPDWKNAVVYTVYPEPELPSDLDLTGQTFRISARMTELDTFVSEGLNGEVINDAVFARNQQVEERFGITLEFRETEKYNGDLDTIVTAGLTEFDLVYGVGSYMPISSGNALDLTDVPYIDFNEPYWYPHILDRFSCYDRVFLAPSDITPTVLRGTIVTFFNKRILSDYDLESPYQMVYNNTWTLDNFLNMVRQVSKDLNGDGLMDLNDLYGIGVMEGDSAGTFMALVFGCGERITARNEDGSLSFAMNGEKIQSIIDRTSEVLKDRSVALDLYAANEKMQWGVQENSPLFAEGHELFRLTFLYNMQGDLREMEDDFGVAPLPKYDETQENYSHRAWVLSTLFAVPSTAPDLKKAGAVFSYMSWLSNQKVIPAYYEITLKQKRTRDEDAAYMLDLIRNTIYFDFGDMFTNMRFYLANSYEGGSYARIVDSTLKKQTKTLNKLQDKLRDLE